MTGVIELCFLTIDAAKREVGVQLAWTLLGTVRVDALNAPVVEVALTCCMIESLAVVTLDYLAGFHVLDPDAEISNRPNTGRILIGILVEYSSVTALSTTIRYKMLCVLLGFPR